MPKVTTTLKKAELDALDGTPISVVSAPRDANYLIQINKVILYKEGSQVAGSSSALNFRYVGDTTVLATFAGINAANGVLNSTVAAYDAALPSAINAIAATACIGKAVEAVLSVAITANTNNVLKIVVDYDLIKLT